MDAALGLNGRLCVVDDLRAPDVCPDVAAARGVTVALADGTEVTTDAHGRFAFPAVTGTQVVTVRATASLIASVVPVTADGASVAVPALRATAFADVLAATGQPGLGGLGAIALYVDEAGGGPVTGAVLTPLAGVLAPVFYDDGPGAWRTAVGTGAAGVALLLGVPLSPQRLDGTAPGGRSVRASGVPIGADALTFVRVTLE